MNVEKNRKRPRVIIELTLTDKIVETIGWSGLLATWVLILTTYPNLPDIIPTHFNGSGQPDGHGTKESIITLPAVASVIFVAMTLLNRVPHIFNYPGEITAENAVAQYTNATKMLRYLKVIIVIVFGFISWGTIQSAVGRSEGLGSWFLPFTLGIILIPTTYFVIKSFKK